MPSEWVRHASESEIAVSSWCLCHPSELAMLVRSEWVRHAASELVVLVPSEWARGTGAIRASSSCWWWDSSELIMLVRSEWARGVSVIWVSSPCCCDPSVFVMLVRSEWARSHGTGVTIRGSLIVVLVRSKWDRHASEIRVSSCYWCHPSERASWSC